jgi:hypothetical protein
MEIERRTVIAAGGAMIALGVADRAAADAPLSPWAGALPVNGDFIKAVLISADADGKSRISEMEVPPDPSLAPKLFQQFLTHKASKVAVFQAPPHHAIAEAKPAKDLLLIVDGETTLKADAGSRRVGRGGFVLFDGVAKHTEKAGPAGYVAIKVRLAE